MPWLKKSHDVAIEDVTALLAPGWIDGRVRIARSPGGVVTLTANNLRRDAAATGTVELLTVPSRLAPTDHLYSARTLRGNVVRFLSSGVLSIDDPSSSLNYLHLTYVPKGGV